MTTTQDAATIAASIDLASVAGHNLRALLLRLADGEEWNADVLLVEVIGELERLSLGGRPFTGAHARGLTPLGREVAELLRPVPWGVGETDVADPSQSVAPNYVPCLLTPTGDESGVFAEDAPTVVHRIAALLTRDDLDAAKTYRTEPDQ
jgi:hypothetical protein